MKKRQNIGERVAALETKVDGLVTIINNLKDMLNPKVERWNKTVTDMGWVKGMAFAFITGIAGALGYHVIAGLI